MPTDAELIQTAITNNAKGGIASASNDSGSVTKHTITEQIKAAQFVAAQNSSSKPHFGLQFTKCIPPGGG